MKTLKYFCIACLSCLISLNLQGQDTTSTKKIQDISQNATDTIVFYNLEKMPCAVSKITSASIQYSKQNITNLPIYEIDIQNVDHIKYSNGVIEYYNPNKGDSSNNPVLQKTKMEAQLFKAGYEDGMDTDFGLEVTGTLFFVYSFVFAPVSIIPAIISGSIAPKIPAESNKNYFPSSYKNGMRLAGKKQKKSVIWYNTIGGTFFGSAFYLLLWQMIHAPK
jgi:hypothetical protein